MLTGCGSGGGQSTDRQSAALRQAVTAYSAAYLSGQGAAAYRLLSPACRQRMTETEMASLTTAAHSLYGNLPVRSFHVDEMTGSDAFVTYTFAEPKLDQSHEHWILEAGGWREDDCT